jgi:hypothetical protein
MAIRDKIIVFKLFFILFVLSIFSAFFIIAPAQASSGVGVDTPEAVEMPGASNQPSLKNAFDTSANSPLNSAAVQGAGYNTSATFNTIISTVITTALGLMGIIFLVLAIYGGYTWMMAAGNDEMVAKAKKTITNAIIGLIIVLAAYIIVRFVVAAVGALVFK